MKKGLIIICAIIMLSGCDSKKETKENITKPEEISYTNKFECSRVEKIKKFDLDNKNAGRLTQEQMKERQNSPVAINEKISKMITTWIKKNLLIVVENMKNMVLKVVKLQLPKILL